MPIEQLFIKVQTQSRGLQVLKSQGSPKERLGFAVAQTPTTHPPLLVKMLYSKGKQKHSEKRRHAINLIAGNTQGKRHPSELS